jgi:hypothetical protein
MHNCLLSACYKHKYKVYYLENIYGNRYRNGIVSVINYKEVYKNIQIQKRFKKQFL